MTHLNLTLLPLQLVVPTFPGNDSLVHTVILQRLLLVVTICHSGISYRMIVPLIMSIFQSDTLRLQHNLLHIHLHIEKHLGGQSFKLHSQVFAETIHQFRFAWFCQCRVSYYGNLRLWRRSGRQWPRYGSLINVCRCGVCLAVRSWDGATPLPQVPC